MQKKLNFAILPRRKSSFLIWLLLAYKVSWKTLFNLDLTDSLDILSRISFQLDQNINEEILTWNLCVITISTEMNWIISYEPWRSRSDAFSFDIYFNENQIKIGVRFWIWINEGKICQFKRNNLNLNKKKKEKYIFWVFIHQILFQISLSTYLPSNSQCNFKPEQLTRIIIYPGLLKAKMQFIFLFKKITFEWFKRISILK